MIHYRGRGEHSVLQLEQIIHELKEKEHYIHAPYAEGCLQRIETLIAESDKDYNSDLEFIKVYFQKILKKDGIV